MMKQYNLSKAIAVFLLLVVFKPALAVVPATLNYQAYLTDDNDVPIDGTADVTVSIYNVEVGGVPLWSETRPGTTVSNGIISVELGSIVPFPPGLFEMPLWLGVTVDADPEMTPRRPISSTGFAFKASDSDTLEGISAASLDQSAHVVDTSNPHNVTTTQIGAVSSADLTAHAGDSSAHHTKTSTFPEMSGQIDDTQIPALVARDAEIMPTVLAGDGPGSTLNADLLDGLNSSAFMSSAADLWVNTTGDAMTGNLTTTGRIGVGIAPPSYSLDVRGITSSSVGYFQNDNSISGANTYGIRIDADGSDTLTGSAHGVRINSLGGFDSGDAYGSENYALANGSSTAYAVYADATLGSTSGDEYAFYGIGEGYFSQDLVVDGTVRMGYERITGSPASLTSTATCSIVNSGTCYYTTTTVACPTGKVVLGGGCNCSSNYNCYIADSYMISSTSYYCRAVGSLSTYTVTPYVTCARVGS